MEQPGRNFKQPPRPKADSDIGAESNDFDNGPGEIQWKQPETMEQYHSMYEDRQGGEASVYDLNNLTDAMGYNAPHGPAKSGQANPGEAGSYGGGR